MVWYLDVDSSHQALKVGLFANESELETQVKEAEGKQQSDL